MVTKNTRQYVTCISSPSSRHLYSSLVYAIAHYRLIGTPTLLTNHITGLGSLYYGDFTQ